MRRLNRGAETGRRGFLKASGMAAAGFVLTRASHPERAFAQPAVLSTFSPTAEAERGTMRVWSDLPAFTRLFANQKEQPDVTSDLYDGVWEGDSVPHLPRVPHPSPVIKRWQSGEGTDY